MNPFTGLILAVVLGGDAAPLDGPNAPFRDELVDRLVGEWDATGTILGGALHQRVSAKWVLNHQYIELDLQDLSAPPPGKTRYEARVFIGYDNLSERYVAHWIDVFGGRWSETLGYGTRSGDRIELVFEYPDGPFHTTFTWNASAGTWSIHMRQKTPAGKWQVFSEQTLRRASSSATP